MSPQLSDFKVLVFDVYGTLCDWETGMYNALQPLISQIDGEKPTRSQILTQLGTIEVALQAEHPTMLYSDILTHAYQHLAQDLKVNATTEECAAFGQSIKDWPIFPDSSDALSELSIDCPELDARPRSCTIPRHVIFLHKPRRGLCWVCRLCYSNFRIQDSG